MTAPAWDVPLYRPDLTGNERRYLLEAFDSGWISSRGAFVERLEASFARYVGAPAATACNGTAALHLALHGLGLRPGDEVIVPAFTYIASVNTIVQAGGTPVFADSDPASWLLDPADVAGRLGPRTRAIMAVHLYGMACPMDALAALARDAGARLLEDCAEALGTRYRGKHVGTFGVAGAFSFYGNKTATTGEGGMVVATDEAFLDGVRRARGQGVSPERHYWHDRFGFNYRMTNLSAAIGLAQMERLDEALRRKRVLAMAYRARLAGLPVEFQEVPRDVDSSHWLVSLLAPDEERRDRIMAELARRGVESRPVFPCAHRLPVHARPGERFPVAEDIAARGLSLPSWPGLPPEALERVAAGVEAAFS